MAYANVHCNFAIENKSDDDKIMMKRKLILLLCMSALCGIVSAQQITLDECRRLAQENYPAIKQYGMIDRSRDYDLKNAATAWLPQVSVSAGGYGFTDIINGDSKAAMMGIDMNNLVASASVTVKQTVYDGGKIALKRHAAEAESDVQSRQLDVAMDDVYDRVEQIYFSILLLDEKIRQNATLQEDLQVSMKTVDDMMQGGIANQSDKDILRVEQLKAIQQHDQLTASRMAYLRMLGKFMGTELGETATLMKPDNIYNMSGDASLRPEMLLYASQEKMLDVQRKSLDANLRPTVGFMGMGAYHTKVSDLINNGILLGGVSLSWNIGALYTRKNDLRRLDEQRQKIGAQRETFLFNNTLQQEQTDGTIDALKKQLSHDDEIVALRENIRIMSGKKVEMGTMSINDLVRAINAVAMARAQKAEHEVMLLQSTYKLKRLKY